MTLKPLGGAVAFMMIALAQAWLGAQNLELRRTGLRYTEALIPLTWSPEAHFATALVTAVIAVAFLVAWKRGVR
jgi:hypothetical protein